MKNPDLDQIRTLRGKNIVIAASAGCGKTTAMISRIADLIIRDGVPVKRLLVLTFTRASAADMTEKLAKKLRAAAPGSPFVRRQLEDLESADICTLDRFCQKILRDCFYLCDLDPAFGVLESDEQRFLEGKIFDRLYADCLQEGDPGFFALTEIFRQGRTNDALFSAVRKLNEFCELSEDPEAYLKEGMFAGLEADPRKNPALRALAGHLADFCLGWQERLARTARKTARLGLAKDERVLSEIADRLREAAAAPPEEVLSRLHALDLPSMSPPDKVQKTRPELMTAHEEAKAVRGRCAEALKTLKEGCPEYSGSFVRAALAETGRCLRALSDFTLRFREACMAEKKRVSRLTFADIEHFCLSILRSEAGEEIRERYEAVFVDECQDINRLQDAVIRAVSRPGNLFCVGDLKQSIYRFRGAEPDLFSARCADAALHPDDQLFRLGTNYRTDVRVLNAVNAVFSALMTPGFARIDYRGEDLLRGVKGGGLSDEKPVEIRAVMQREKTGRSADEEETPDHDDENAAEAEGRMVAGIIRELTDGTLRFTDPGEAADRAARGLPPTVCCDDIAVLVRGRSSVVRTVMQVLKEHSIPLSAEFDVSAEDYPELLLLLDFLRILDNTRQDIPLAAVMRSFLGGFSDRELAGIRAAAPREVRFFWDCLFRYVKTGGDAALRKKCGDFLNLVARFREAAGRLEVSELLALICRECAVESWLSASPGGREKAAVLQSFLLSLEGKKQAETLCGYLEYLSRFKSPPLAVRLPSGSRGAVHLTTVHKSKGLEYPIVILCGLSAGFRLSDDPHAPPVLFDREIGACMNFYDTELRQVFPSFAAAAGRIRRREAALREELNLLYVAMTRPRHKLILTGSFDPEKPAVIRSDADIREMRAAFPVLLSLLQEQPNVHTVLCRGPKQTGPEAVLPVTLNARPNPLTEGLEAGMRAAYAFPQSLGLPRKSTVTELSRAEASFLSGSGMAQEGFLPLGGTARDLPDGNTAEGFSLPGGKLTAGGALTDGEAAAAWGLPADPTKGDAFDALLPRPLQKGTRVRENNRSDRTERDPLPDRERERLIDRGTAYHLALELVELSASTPEAVRAQLERLLEEGALTREQFELIRPSLLSACLNTLAPLTEGGQILREQPFLMEAEQPGGFLLVQGKIDLLILRGKEAVLVDYKFSGHTDDELAAQYAPQLARYAEAVRRAGFEVKARFLYSFSGNRLIPV